MRFEDAYEGWTEKRLTQIDATRLPSMCPRTFRRALNPSAGSGATDTRKTAWPSMMRHQDGSQQQGCVAVLGPDCDPRDPRACRGVEATNGHYSMFFCDEEGIQSRWRGVGDLIERQSLFCSLYTDRGRP